MTLDEAKIFLSNCIRTEYPDHTHGDCEIFWTNPITNDEVAIGYRGRIDINVSIGAYQWSGEKALELISLGLETEIGENDSTDPDLYQDEVPQDGLTFDEVLREITQ